MLSHTIGLDTVRQKRAVRQQKRNEGQVGIEVTQETNSTNTQERGFMARQTVNVDYLEAMEKFLKRVAKDRTQALVDAGDTDAGAVGVYAETGRKYDKIMTSVLKKGASSAKIQVEFFVDRSTGAIYGQKSPVAPNETRYFGTIYNASKWDWSGEFPKNVSDDTVEESRGYGNVSHYRLKQTA